MKNYIKNMKRLLIVTERFWPEEFIINDLAAEAVEQGFEVTVFTQQPSYPQGRIYKGWKNRAYSRDKWSGLEVIRIKTVLGYKDSLFLKLLNYLWFSIYGSIVAFFLHNRFDHILIYQTGPLTMAIPGILLGKLRRIPVVIWTQDVWPDTVYAYGFRKTGIRSHLLDNFVRWIYRSVAGILISCEGFSQIIERYTSKTITYAPNWPLTSFRSYENNKSVRGIPTFLFAGNIGKVQNLENVIKGFAIAVQQNGFNGILRIVGDGSALEDMRRRADEEGISVEFPGRKHSSEMDEEYRNATFLILSLADKPVFRLTVPSKFQMYLSVGKPILCAAEGEVRTLVKNFNIGIDVDSSSPTSISKGFLTLLNSDKSQIERWSSNARDLLENTFNRKQIIDKILSTVEKANFDFIGK